MVSQDIATVPKIKALSLGSGLALLGVLTFSFSLPATELALHGFHPYLVGVGRAVVAGAIAAVFLWARRAPLPSRSMWPGLVLTAAGVVFGFPVLTSIALDLGAGAAHSAVVVGLLPAMTAIMAVIRAGERPRPGFWVACVAGAVVITVFTLSQGGPGGFTLADLLLVAALALCAVGYTEGARLARERPGWQVICWALVASLPISVPVSAVLTVTEPPTLSAEALVGFGYVSLFSMLFGFFAWYAGLAQGGIARAGQLQLLQPLLTLVWAWLFLGERFGVPTVAAALAVVICVAVTQRTRG